MLENMGFFEKVYLFVLKSIYKCFFRFIGNCFNCYISCYLDSYYNLYFICFDCLIY